jgi:hypothetical protein
MPLAFPGRAGRGRLALAGGNGVPVAIPLRSRVDSEMCREAHVSGRSAGLPGAPAKTREFRYLFRYLCGKTAFLPLSNHIS